MLKRTVFIIPVIFLFTGCLKSTNDPICPYTESNVVAPASEIAILQSYINATYPAAIQHSSGLFYEIISPGAGATPGVCSNVTVKYSGYLTNGTKFDENLTGLTFTLGQLILGWQKGLPLIQKGGSINLYIPPSLGYGASQVGTIPPNSILVFVIQLVDVQ